MKNIGLFIIIFTIGAVVERIIVTDTLKKEAPQHEPATNIGITKGVFLHIDTTGKLLINGDTEEIFRAYLLIMDEWYNAKTKHMP